LSFPHPGPRFARPECKLQRESNLENHRCPSYDTAMTKRRKRELGGTLEVEGWPLRWTLKSEQIWSPDGNHVGLRLSVERTDEAHRELILEYPFRDMPGGKTERPDPDPHRIADDVRLAIEAGWKPKSRGRPFTLVCD